MAAAAAALLAILLAAAGPAAAQIRAVELGDYQRPLEQFTDRPIIGVLTLPVTVRSQRKYGTSSFATSYARWVEAGGGRVMPIFYDATEEELSYLLNRLNGIFWTGGLVEFNPVETDPEGAKYLRTTRAIFEHVYAENERGNYYPLWGTCLGFERLVQLFAQDVNATYLRKVDAENYDINLGFTTSGWLSRLFGGMTYELFKEVASPIGHLAFNNHGLGYSPEDFRSSPAGDDLKVLSVDKDRNGMEFVSTIEGRLYPFYGTQWHPEKAPWEWTPKYQMSHLEAAISFSNYLGRFFCNECKYNRNRFDEPEDEERFLIHNWPSRPTGKMHGISSAYSEIIFFKERAPWNETRRSRFGAVRSV